MKNFLRIAMLALVVCATSCAREDISSNLVGGGDAIEVTFTADLGELGTRTATVGDGSHVDRVYLGIYENNQPLNYLDNLTEDEGYLVTGGKATFSVVLLKDKVYDLVFWAQKAGLKTTEGKDVYNMDWKKRELTVDYTGVLSQAEERDAFYLVQKGFKAGHDETVFKLYRPFAQLNAGLSKVEVENITHNGVEVTSLKSKAVVRKVANKLFLGQNNHGKIDKDNLVEVEFGSAPKPAEELKVSSAVTGGPFEYVSLNYLLVNEEQLVEVDYTFTDNESTNYERTYYSVPVKRNYRTNIVGALLSSPIDFTVEIVPEFTNSPEEDYNREVWDGKSVSEPDYDATTQTYTIDNGSELAWLADTVNGTTRAAADSMKGKTVVLSESIDLGGAEWTPIGVGGNHFMGTFDGNGKTISNFRISKRPGDCDQAALFGTISGTVAIQNFTIKDVEIDYPGADDFYAAAVVGTFYGNVTLKDIVVEDCYISGNNKVAGLAAHDGVCSSLLIDNCHVKNSVLETLNEEDGGNVAGLLGLFQGVAKEEVANQPLYGVHEVKNSSVTGCTIKGGNKNSEGKRSSGEFIANFIGKDGQSLHINNCKIENNTFTQAGTYTSMYLPFVGGARYNDGKGTIYVDGKKIVAEGVTFDEQAKTYYVSTAAGLAWVASVVNATTPYTPTIFDEATVELTNDIDLNNEEWIPIGDDRSQRTEWHGVFDGKGYTVYNVKITKKTDRDDENKSSYGLFGNVKGTVKNLTVENVSISGAPKFIGALVGRLNDGLIENCHVKSSNVECKNWTIGGLVGQFNNGKISGCSVEGTTVTGYAAVGAIVGIALNSGERIIEDCSVKDCTIAQNGSFGGDFDKMFGAVAGALNNGALTVDFVNCTVENTTILGEISDTICGYAAEGDTILINGGQSLAGYPSIFVKDNEYMIFNLAGLKDLNKFFKNNSMANDTWGRTYSIGADIDATGYTWEGVYIITGSNAVDGIVIEGNNHTISNLTIKDCLLSGTANGGDDGTAPGEINNLTLDKVTVNGGSFTSPLWGNLSGDLTYNNVHVVNSNITGTNNVGGLLASTGEGTDYYVVFNNCSVENTKITANGANGQDPTGASGFFGRAFAKTYVTFTGTNVVSGNTITNNNGLVGGEVYAYTTWIDNGFAATGACDTFTNWAGIAEVVSVSSATEMTDANGKTGIIESGSVTTMTGNIATSAKDTDANSGYGATGIKVDGGILDGNGNTITVSNANSTWDCAVNTTGGTIKNLTVAGAMRGIFMGEAKADTYIDNVIFKDVIYTFNSDGGNKNYGVYISNSTLNGWTSFSDVHKEVVFTNCKFGKGSGYAYCRPYNETLFKNCEFAEGFTLEPLANIVLEGCTLNGVAITAENLSALVTNTSKVTLK